jgi:hypothetical protein
MCVAQAPAAHVVIEVTPHRNSARDGAGALSDSTDRIRIVYERDYVALSQQTAHSGRSRARSTARHVGSRRECADGFSIHPDYPAK